ncbi:MAG: hypothetical protein E4G99_00590 [Anaerolineales bacterium]|nr:MAG: hypothetical protein E4G99_00590 [Anaerolineales bacterium]
MKPIQDMTQAELGAYVQSHLREKGIDVVLSGGAVVALYTSSKYVSGDLDFVNRYAIKRSAITTAMEELEFTEVGRHFEHPGTEFFVEFPPGPLAIGESHAIELSELELDTGKLVLITPTECVKDRLAWYYHAGDNQSLYQAILVARDQSVDLEKVKKWSEGEGKLEEFGEFIEQLNED